MSTKLTLLGTVTVEDERRSLPRFRSVHTMALLGYCVTQRRPLSRQHLATLLWPDVEPSEGRTKLRRELYNLAQLLPDCWQTDRNQVEFVGSADTEIDLDEVSKLIDLHELTAAAALFQGEFLEGVSLDNDNFELETWLSGERERWRLQHVRVLEAVIAQLKEKEDYKAAIPYANALVARDSWREETHQQLMWLYAADGQRGAALAQYERCRRILEDEVGVEPTAETLQLYNQIMKMKGETLTPAVHSTVQQTKSLIVEPLPQRKPRRWPLILAGVILVGVLLLSGWYAQQPSAEEIEAWLNSAELLTKDRSDPPQALALAAQAYAANPDNPRAIYLNCVTTAQNWVIDRINEEQVDIACTNCIDDHPNEIERTHCRNFRGWWHLARGELKSAEQDALTIIASDTRYALGGFELIGAVYLQLDDPVRAVESFTTAIVGPSAYKADLYWHRAHSYVALGDYTAARADIAEYEELIARGECHLCDRDVATFLSELPP